MHLEHLTVENVGPFKGVQRVDFDFSQEKNINVICGGNGSGKTSLFRSIEWALGRTEQNEDHFYSRYLVHNGTRFACVTLRFSMGGRDYKVSRRRLGADEEHRSEEVQLSVRMNCDEDWEHVSTPGEHIQAMLPQDVRAIIFDFEGDGLHSMFQQSHPNLLSIPRFRVWAGDRIEKSHFAALGGQGDRTITFLKHYFAGRDQHEAKGIVQLAWMHTMMLFREWFHVSDSLPSAWVHLRGESLPWLIDKPFGALDAHLRSEAAESLARSKSQVVLAVGPLELVPPAETLIEPSLGRLHLLRTGDNYFAGSSAHLFGQNLVLSRGDGTHFSEIVSVVGSQEHQRTG